MFGGKWTAIVIMVLAIAIRLVRIDQPFVDPWSWRQSDVGAIAQNYYSGGFNFALPQIDWAGETAGYVGTEFPVLPFLAALSYKWFGVHEWIGRAQSLIFFAASLPIFYLLVRRIFDRSVALWALVCYSFAPLSIAASRVFMPDMPSLALALAGIYFYLHWLDSENAGAFFAASVCTSLALLIKAPTAIIGLPFLYLTWQRFRWRALLRLEVWVFGAFALVPSAIWYAHANNVCNRYYPHHMFGDGGFKIMSVGWYGKIAWQIFASSLTPVLSLLAIFGALVRPRGKYSLLFHWWLAAMVGFIVVAGWGNRHQWYQLPLVPIAAVFAAGVCARLVTFFASSPISILIRSGTILLLFGVWSFASARPFFLSPSSDLLRLGFELKKITASSALIIAADDGDPTLFYYAERKGWHFLEDGVYNGPPGDGPQAIAEFGKLRRRGATHFVFCRDTQSWLQTFPDFAEHLRRNTTLLETEPAFAIYRVNPETVPHHP